MSQSPSLTLCELPLGIRSSTNRPISGRFSLSAAAGPRPGDLLFIPRGFPHIAPNKGKGNGKSTHLTIGPHVYFWQTVEATLHHAVMTLKPKKSGKLAAGAGGRLAQRKLKQAMKKEVADAKRQGRVPELAKKFSGFGG